MKLMTATKLLLLLHLMISMDDDRKTVSLSTFGFLTGGTLAVNVTLSGVSREDAKKNASLFGFTLDKSTSPGLSRYMEEMQNNKCILNNSDMENKNGDNVESVFFKFDFPNLRLNFERVGSSLGKLVVTNLSQEIFKVQHHLHRRSAHTHASKLSDALVLSGHRSVRAVVQGKEDNADPSQTSNKATDTGDGTPVSKTTPAPDKTPQNASKTGPDDAKTGRLSPKTEPDTAQMGAVSATTSSEPTSSPSGGAGAGPSQAFANAAAKEAAAPLLTYTDVKEVGEGSYQTYFLVYIARPEEEGLYNLYFHNCLHYQTASPSSSSVVSLMLEIVEDNNGNYLTAGEMPVPALYFTFSILFFITGVAWLSVLRRSKEDVYKIHYLMLVVIFIKSLACLFHGVNMYFIQINGVHEEAWAILWYIVYLTRGALMFVTVLLIGAGWAFIKHVLTDREKKLFLIVIPLQVLDRVAWVIVEESEEGNQSYTTWNEIFILVDLLCCGAILFPVVWSIRHLQEASHTDGKAAINLQKLKLFRHFYILVVCYIYFTRIIVYLMKITLPFKLEWLTDLFTELAMMVFFIVTGVKFRPATDNPYLQVPLDSDDEEIEMEEVLTKTGNRETVVKVNQKTEGSDNSRVKQRESSHEYD
nr:hypothetical protein BaRGS_027410 [Batillaria attramentaria]